MKKYFYRLASYTAIAASLLLNTANAQVISTVAGTSTFGYTGDGGLADTAELYNPYAVAVDKAGNIYIADYALGIVRKVTKATGIITTIAGTGTNGSGGDGGPATNASLNSPSGVAIDTAGNIYISDTYNQRIREVNVSTGNISTVAGNGFQGYSGDNGSATNAELNYPSQLASDKAGNIYIADESNNVIRKITTATNIITTVAGNGNNGFAGDGNQATTANLDYPTGVAVDKNGNIYIADQTNQRIREVNAASNIITTVAGMGGGGPSGSGVQATSTQLNYPYAVAVDTNGNIYISDETNNMVKKVNTNDTITTMAGISQYSYGYNGDNIEATSAELYNPLGIAVDNSGNIFVVDQSNYRIREINVTGPNIVQQPQSISACPGSTAYFTVGVTGSGVTYQWMLDSNGTSSFDTLKNNSQYAGVNSDSLQLKSLPPAGSNYLYECIINGGYVTSNAEYLNMQYLPSITLTQPTDSICPGVVTTLSATGQYIGIIQPPHGSSHQPINGYGTVIWNNADTTYSITVSPSVTTTYSVSLNESGCTLDTTIVLEVDRTKINPIAFPSSTVCSGNSVSLNGQGGDGNYSWSNGVVNGQSFIPANSNTYTVTAFDGLGCTLVDTQHVTVNPSPNILITDNLVDTVCTGSQEILSASGASSYMWNDGVSSNVPFTITASHIYSVTGTDINGCVGNAQLSIIVEPLPTITGSSSPDAVCAGGSVVLTGNGGASYSWSGGVSNGVPFVPLNSGTYTVTAASTFGCTNTASVAVTVNPKPVISATAFPSAALCQGSSLALFGSGGASYAWSGGVNNGVSFTPASSITYTLTGIDDNGCTNTDSIKVTVHNKVVPTLTSLNTSCGLKNGSAAVVASNGTPPYTYTWSTTPVIYTAAVDSLAAGTYVVSVSDSANCASTVAVSIAASTAPILSVSATNSNCGTVGTGSASVVVTGGTTPYHYLWNNGDTLPNDFNLKAATYIITVTDVNGCSTFAPAIVSNNNGPVIATTSLVNVTCFGAATGAISVSVSGGTAPYTYNWSNGATTASIGSLYQGPYQLTIMDADSCTSVKTFTINQPKNTISVAASSLRANCGVADGAATVAVSGGTSPYAYSWNNAVSTAKDSDLAAGVYSVIITDGNGCIDSAHVSVSDKNGPALKLTLTSNATCAAGGLLSVAATGINMPFTYAWSNGSSATSIANIPAGNYDVTVTDAHGCVSSADTSVVELAPPVKPLCMVTVDPISNKHNIIVWNKTNATQIASYNVYKESTTAGVYFKIASVPATDSTQFIDTLSDPTVRSWRYELSQVDSCGNESQLSPDQKTMHLTVNQGLGNNINLIWDNYEGLNFSTYYIYKDTINTSFTVIDSIPNNIFTYTDQHYWKTSKPLLYRIGVINPNGCDPAARTLAINYNATKSNTGNLTFNPIASSVNTINTPIADVQVFPNPSTGLVTFALQLPAKEQDLTLSIINTLGQVVLTTQYNCIAGAVSKTIDLSTLAKGVYFAKIYNNNSTLYRKIVLQ